MRVLLIEPDLLLGQTSAATLKAAGYKVSHSRTAQSAVQAADAHRPDIVVLNASMARHNGIEFLYEFKSYPEWQHIPVLLMVSRAQYAIAEAAVLRERLGVVEVLLHSQLGLTRLCKMVADVAGRQAA